MRDGFVRRCEVCCRFRDDREARVAAEPELARFALRERPSAYLPADTGAMRCPWCGHLPSNEDIDTFWLLSDAECFERARVGRTSREQAEEDEGEPRLVLLHGPISLDEDTCDELRLRCPNPACWKTFEIPDELDFYADPDEF
jgi:hypothetical protein